MDRSPVNDLPFVMPAQAQKHITVNAALARLDALLHARVAAMDGAMPPANPAPGEAYVLGESPEGDWDGKGGALAIWQDGRWAFVAARAGLTVWSVAEGAFFRHDGDGWAPVLSGPFDSLGINTGADETNRFALSGAASLFTHDGTDHRLKINRKTAGDAASVVFQTGYDGAAEFGLIGDDSFRLKVSPDGAVFTDAIVVDRQTGAVSLGGDRLNVGQDSSLGVRHDAETGRDFDIFTRASVSAIAVPSFRPASQGQLAFDLMPNGAPGDFFGNGVAWMDICDTDCAHGNPPMAALRAGARPDNFELGIRRFNDGPLKPLLFTMGGAACATLGTDGGWTFHGDVVFEAPPSGLREVLSVDRTYHVDAVGGSDSADGLSAASALQTLAEAVSRAARLDANGHDLVIQLADGTHSVGSGIALSVPIPGCDRLRIVGNSAAPGSVTIASTGRVFAVTGVGLELSGCSLETSGANASHLFATGGAMLRLSDLVFGASGRYHVECLDAHVIWDGDYTVAGGAQAHLQVQANGIVEGANRTVTLTGSPAFSRAFCEAQTGASVLLYGWSFSGGASGARYRCSLNAVINTYGGGADKLPGDSAGISVSGGQYG